MSEEHVMEYVFAVAVGMRLNTQGGVFILDREKPFLPAQYRVVFLGGISTLQLIGDFGVGTIQIRLINNVSASGIAPGNDKSRVGYAGFLIGAAESLISEY